MGRAASRYVASPTPKRRSADTSPNLLRSGASRPFITGTYNGCVYYPLRAAGPKTRDRAPSLCPRSTLRNHAGINSQRRRGAASQIGIGGRIAPPPLPHHRTYGSVYGGSIGYAIDPRPRTEVQTS